MQLSTLLLGALTLTASALPTPPASRKRDFAYHSTISDEGFYAASNPPDYHEDQILQWNQLPTTNGSTSALIARFPAGFSVTQSGPAKINVYTRTSGGIGTYLGTVGPLSVDTGLVAEAVDVVVAELTPAESYTFEFQIDSEDENASLQFFENDSAGFFLRTGSA
ncbi:hypothetical protein G7054_g4225 [Neopestalotiopsis clavispora]|nr:hypothetical protein G7054_g4225 [Neopestalotiopsis clavispora]